MSSIPSIPAAVDAEPRPQEDHFVHFRNATWADYQRALELRGEGAVPRITFLEGLLEIMTPSRNHESIKSMIGCLVEVWCLERDIEFNTYGSLEYLFPSRSCDAQHRSDSSSVHLPR